MIDLNINDCLYPECQVKGDTGKGCEHSCPFEKQMKRPKPDWKACLASEVPGGSCQFPRCDC